MNLSIYLVAVPFLIMASCCQLHAIPCNCGLGIGREICSDHGHDKSCSPLVVRPLELPKPTLSSILRPIGGVCSCQSPLVIPALVPRPPCRHCTSGAHYRSNSLTKQTSAHDQATWWAGQSQQHQHYQQPQQNPSSPVDWTQTTGSASAYGGSTGASYAGYDGGHVIDASNPAHAAAADAVSLHIAYKQSLEDCHHTSEDKLAFGFRKLPKEVPQVVRKVKNIPEEKLNSLNGQVVELKKVKCGPQQSVDEEAVEALLDVETADQEEDENHTADVKHLSLGEIGYAPAKIKSVAFVDIPLEGVHTSAHQNHQHTCNDGFKPGSVSISAIPKPEYYPIPSPLPPPCQDDNDEIAGKGAVIPTVDAQGSYNYVSTAQSHQTTQSYQSNSQTSNMVEKLGYSYL